MQISTLFRHEFNPHCRSPSKVDCYPNNHYDTLLVRRWLASFWPLSRAPRARTWAKRKMSDWSTRDHVTLPNSTWRQYLHCLFIPVERRLIAAHEFRMA